MSTKRATDVFELGNILSAVISDACAEYVRRQKAGSSASMNGALEYIDLRVADEAIKWFESRQALAEQPK